MAQKFICVSVSGTSLNALGKVEMKSYCIAFSLFFVVTLLSSCQTSDVLEEEVLIAEKTESTFFIRDPLDLKPVVQFSCVEVSTEETREEDAWEADLNDKDDKKKLIALGKLISLSAPSSVPIQYMGFLDLKKRYVGHNSVKSAKEAFNKKRIISVLSQDLPKNEYSMEAIKLYWCIRAVGVLKMEVCIPRLLELSDVDNLYTYLAAERSIEDFDGEKAEDALIHIVSCWRYNAFVRAGSEIMRRNPDRFSRELEKMTPPDEWKYQYGLFLARCKNPKAVPILCDTVKKIGIVDSEMFNHIAALGQLKDKDKILALPNNVREEQQERARDCVKKYLERMEKNPNKKDPLNAHSSRK